MTISEIAKMAGVSAAAVSRYLNQGYISEDKKEKIRRVIEETGYRPSVQAQMLRTKKTRMIGVVLPKIDSEAVSRVVAGISQGLSKREYELLLANTENNIEKELDYLKIFNNDRVDGIIFIATLLTARHKELIKALNVPVVVVGQACEYASCIYHDDKNAARALAELLLKRGRKRIAYLGVTRRDAAAGEQRYQGFMEAMGQAGRKPEETDMYECEFTMVSGYKRCREAFSRNPSIDGVFCATDTIALGAMKYLRELGKRLPEEVSLTGIGHTRISEITVPTLTTAHYYYEESGKEAVSLLFELLENENVPKKRVMMGFEVKEQKSV
ncbi:LacI family DNA-binding transcriptional regulator [Clostridium sp. Marseille-P2415]|uniref:LacI family DNA-binding transcriptional regulator n=1 Tax=Clostridium sp. Marseille-P2415 TaxID=1805471 RepID=UPI000988540F|nr:LacI family DNA-binding transcriptional regulator [Clostridium sp. Marseille-P2415]